MTATPENKKILNVYAALSVSLIMSFMPMMTAAFLATIMFIGVMVAAYVLRKRADEKSLTADHMTFIIRTIWIAGLLAMITITLGSFYMLSLYDPTPLLACMGSVPAEMTYEALWNMVGPCVPSFIEINKETLIQTGIISAGPVVLYFVYRLAKGLSRAQKGHRIGDVKNWF